MTRKEKIELLKAIALGRRTIGCLSLPIALIWIQDSQNQNLFYCKDEDLSVSCEAECPKLIKGRDVINIMIICGSAPLEIAEHEP